MTPVFRIIANQNDITASIASRLLSLKITDEAGIKSDTLELELDDRDFEIAWPSHGAELSVSLGYKETSLEQLGTYIVDEIGHGGPPNVLSIRAKAADMRASLKAPKTQSWGNVTIGDIVSTIASTHGYTPKVSDALSRINVLHLDQTDESDLHFLTRLARENNAISKPAGGHWLFVTKGEGKSASGIELPEINVNTTELISHRLTHAERGKYSSVIAHWHDVKKGQRIPVRAGVDEPVYSMRHNYPDESQALRAANSKLLSLSRGVQSLSLTVVGGTKYQAEGRLNLSGLRAPLNNSWLIIRVAHQLGPGGFVTRVDAEAPS